MLRANSMTAARNNVKKRAYYTRMAFQDVTKNNSTQALCTLFFADKDLMSDLLHEMALFSTWNSTRLRNNHKTSVMALDDLDGVTSLSGLL